MRLSVIDCSLRYVVACACASVALAVPLAVAQSAHAATFGCSSCNNVSGPNQSMKFTEGINYDHYEIWVTIWKYNGGSNYNVSQEGFTMSNYKLTLESGCYCYIDGHGQVGQFKQFAHLGGNDY